MLKASLSIAWPRDGREKVQPMRWIYFERKDWDHE
jgi:hypothetical protein